MKGYLVRLTSFASLFALTVAMLPASAAQPTITISVPNANGEIMQADKAGYATTTFGWDPTMGYTTSSRIVFYVTWSKNQSTVTAPSSTWTLAPCANAQTTLFGAAGSFAYTNQPASKIGEAVWTFSSSTVANPGADNVCFRVPVTEDTAGTLVKRNFSVAFINENTSNPDFGAVLFYVGNDVNGIGGNDVYVTGYIVPTLSFMIASTTVGGTPTNNIFYEQHVCDLGFLDYTQRESCSYRLKISTNAQGGFQTTIESDHKFGTGYATLTDIADNGTTTIGIESYGMDFFGALEGGRNTTTGAFDQPMIVSGTFTTNTSPVPVTPATLISSYTDGFAGTSTAQTALVTHWAATSPGTPSGHYSHTVTYRTTGNF